MTSEAIEAPATAKTAVPVDTTSISAQQRRKLDRSPRSQIVVTGILVVVALYFIVPLYWVVIAATKTTGALFSTNGFWFGGEFALWSNLQQVFTYDGGIFVRWIANSILYSGVGAVLATYFAAAGTGASGSVTRKHAPAPGEVSTSTVPPCPATSAATIASPRPVLSSLRARDGSAR